MFKCFSGSPVSGHKSGTAGGGKGPVQLSSAWDNALTVAQSNNNNKVAGAQPTSDAASAAAAALSKKRAQQRRQAKDEKAPKVLFCLTLTNPLRKTCIRIIEHTYPLLHFHHLGYQLESADTSNY